ncbi:MAG: DUF2185 domain-containing protein [Ruminococcus sp.]|nr:DUF2185 domain-containing protein [Ruminococcus sp.]
MNERVKRDLLEQINELHKQGKHEDIVDLMQNCDDIRTDPELGIIAARTLLDLTENEMSDDLTEAAEALLLSLPNGEKLPSWNYQIARSYFMRNRTIEAVRRLETAIELAEEGTEFAEAEESKELLEICMDEYKKMDIKYTDSQHETVLRHIEHYYGRITAMVPSNDPLGVTPDIVVIEPDAVRNFRTLVTVGMGGYKMEIPDELEGMVSERCELVMLLPPEWTPEQSSWVISFMRSVAVLPAERRSWCAYGHMFSGGKTLCPETKLCSAILIETQGFEKGSSLCKFIDETSVSFYQLFPLYKEEMEHKLKYGLGSLLKKMSSLTSPVLQLDRENFCADEKTDRRTLLAEETDYTSNLGIGEFCAASKKILDDGMKVGYMRRFLFNEEPAGMHSDSGWLFMSGAEDAEFFSNPYNLELASLNTVCNIDPDIVPLLTLPYNTVCVRGSDGMLHPEPPDDDRIDKLPPS